LRYRALAPGWPRLARSLLMWAYYACGNLEPTGLQVSHKVSSEHGCRNFDYLPEKCSNFIIYQTYAPITHQQASFSPSSYFAGTEAKKHDATSSKQQTSSSLGKWVRALVVAVVAAMDLTILLNRCFSFSFCCSFFNSNSTPTLQSLP